MYPPSTIITSGFWWPTDNLVDADWTKTLLKNGVDSAIAVTVTKVKSSLGGAEYKFSFTPDSSTYVNWHVSIMQTSQYDPPNNFPVQGISRDFLVTTAFNNLSSSDVASAVEAIVPEPEGSVTLKKILSALFAVLCGQTSSAGAVFKTPNGVATRITAVVNDQNERTSITLNLP